MQTLYSTLLESTLEYGEGHARQVEMDKKGESETKNFDCAKTLGRDFLDYHIYKIRYNLKSNEYIQSLQIIFKNRNTGVLVTLLETEPEEEKTNEYELGETEEINEVRVWLKNSRLIGFEITTNAGKSKKIGYGEFESTKIEEFANKDKIIFGFGCHANKQYGVSSLYCYFTSKRQFGIIQNSGLLHLRAKLKQNEEYKSELEARKSTLTPKQKLILETCDLPDAAFFPVASYIMSY